MIKQLLDEIVSHGDRSAGAIVSISELGISSQV